MSGHADELVESNFALDSEEQELRARLKAVDQKLDQPSCASTQPQPLALAADGKMPPKAVKSGQIASPPILSHLQSESLLRRPVTILEKSLVLLDPLHNCRQKLPSLRWNAQKDAWTFYVETEVKGHSKIVAKLNTCYSELDDVSEKISEANSAGIVDGFSPESGTVIPKAQPAAKSHPRAPNAKQAAKAAPACRLGSVARAAVADGAYVQSLQDASKVHPAHGERDAHRIFQKYWLSLRVQDMVKYLLQKHPENLLGGECLVEGPRRCQEFWDMFEAYQPNHAVYIHHKDHSRVIPVCVHGDKGRTLKKSPVACYSWEAVWGLPAHLRNSPEEGHLKKRTHDKYDTGRLGLLCCERPAREETDEAAAACTIKRRRLSGNADEKIQAHNSLGHSFLTHFLFTAVPHSVYSADSTAVLGGVLKEMAQNLCSLFWDGVEVNSQRYHVALVGVKGDAEFHVEAAELLRSFYTVGTVNNLLMCPECHADDNFSDVSDRPVWLGSVGQSVPWDPASPPPLAVVPFSADGEYPAFLYKRDMFHIIKHGVGREACASILLMLAYNSYFDSPGDLRNLPERLSRKGADVTLVLMFLDFFLGLCLLEPNDGDRQLLSAMLHLVRSTLSFLGGLLWASVALSHEERIGVDAPGTEEDPMAGLCAMLGLLAVLSSLLAHVTDDESEGDELRRWVTCLAVASILVLVISQATLRSVWYMALGG
ncbi:Uncharacterized protein SCF082_LOCUS30742, partial [Durusdinium trenchii]